VQAVPAMAGQAMYYVFADQIDTPRIIIRPSDNQMVWRWDAAEPFGNATPNENPSGLGAFSYNSRFPGQLYDKESNLQLQLLSGLRSERGKVCGK
jgi:uncharacterized protein RhaS with RHS repeats